MLKNVDLYNNICIIVSAFIVQMYKIFSKDKNI